MMNVLHGIPYETDRMGKRQLVGEEHLQLMQIALRPGQAVPPHNANSNVHLLVLTGGIHVDLDGAPHDASQGTLLPVAHGTPMRIENRADGDASFLVIKSPHPSQMKT